jgi:hypothetical protein
VAAQLATPQDGLNSVSKKVYMHLNLKEKDIG